MSLSKLILGCEQIGGKDHGYINQKALKNVFLNSLKFGINTFDTAAIYNLGKSEENLNKIFGTKLKNLNVITKGGLDYKFLKTSKRAQVFKRFDKKFLEESILLSCKRLKLNTIPLFLIHYPPDDEKTIINVCSNLEQFKKKKLILQYGFCNIDFKLFNYAYLKFKIFAVQNSLNLFNYKEQIINFKKINVRVKKIVHSALAQGMLSGKYTHQSKFSKLDRRSRMNFFYKKNLYKNYKKVMILNKLAHELNTSSAILSLSYLINCRYADSIIVGIKNILQFKDCLNAVSFDLKTDIKKKIEEIFFIN
jgi:aryl-alcohol dehydrogenase-like predicted oxidoreductase